MSFDEVMARLSPQTRQRIKLASEITEEYQKLPSLGITRALGGGFRYGSIVNLWGNKSGGKAQPVDTIIPTPKGDKRFGDLCVGDFVFGANGNPTEVVAIHPQGVVQQFKVEFNDGTFTFCNPDHLWKIQTRKQKYGVGRNGKSLKDNWRIVAAKNLIEERHPIRQYGDSIGKHLYQMFIPLPEPIMYDRQELLIDPYLMGLLLGDGNTTKSSCITITMNDEDCIIEARNRSGVRIEERTYETSTARHWRVFEINKFVRDYKINQYSYNKFVPLSYMNSSTDDRLWLLRGLMDSDGSQEDNDRAAFHSTSLKLAEDVAMLVRSLGGVARIDFKPRLDKRNEYKVVIWMPENPFFLDRKAIKYHPLRPWFKAVRSIIEVEPTEMVCITVASPDGLYLTNDYIVTHNSALCLGTVALAQTQGKVCAWFDAEGSFRPSWAAQLGVDPPTLLMSQSKSFEDVTNVGVDWMRAGVDLIVIDSSSVLAPGSYFDKDGGLKSQSDVKQIGQFSREIGIMLNMFNIVNTKTLVLIISQVRTNIGSYGGSLTYTGGKAMEHYPSTSIKLWASLSEKEQITGDVISGDQIFTEAIGRPVTWTIDKDRGPGMNMSDTYNFYFKGERLGIDNVEEILSIGTKTGKVRRSGAWYYFGEEKFQGSDKAVRYLLDNPDVYKELWDDIVG